MAPSREELQRYIQAQGLTPDPTGAIDTLVAPPVKRPVAPQMPSEAPVGVAPPPTTVPPPKPLTGQPQTNKGVFGVPQLPPIPAGQPSAPQAGPLMKVTPEKPLTAAQKIQRDEVEYDRLLGEAKAQRDAEIQIRKNNEAQRQAFQQKWTEWEKAQEELLKAPAPQRGDIFSTDKNTVWGRKSTGQKIAFVLGRALTAMAAVATDRDPQKALSYFDNIIEKDLEEQRAVLANKQKLHSFKGSSLQRAQQVFNDNETADLAAKSAAWNSIMTEANAMRQKIGDQKIDQRFYIELAAQNKRAADALQQKMLEDLLKAQKDAAEAEEKAKKEAIVPDVDRRSLDAQLSVIRKTDAILDFMDNKFDPGVFAKYGRQIQEAFAPLTPGVTDEESFRNLLQAAKVQMKNDWIKGNPSDSEGTGFDSLWPEPSENLDMMRQKIMTIRNLTDMSYQQSRGSLSSVGKNMEMYPTKPMYRSTTGDKIDLSSVKEVD